MKKNTCLCATGPCGQICLECEYQFYEFANHFCGDALINLKAKFILYIIYKTIHEHIYIYIHINTVYKYVYIYIYIYIHYTYIYTYVKKNMLREAPPSDRDRIRPPPTPSEDRVTSVRCTAQCLQLYFLENNRIWLKRNATFLAKSPLAYPKRCFWENNRIWLKQNATFCRISCARGGLALKIPCQALCMHKFRSDRIP